MKKLEKLRLKGISEILSEKELKNVMGGSCYSDYGSCDSSSTCSGKCGTLPTFGGTIDLYCTRLDELTDDGRYVCGCA